MPIKFACPECKKVMTVADNMAGKNGKCKCGNKITVPAGKEKAAAGAAKSAAAASPALSAMMDELTESDYGRVSPYEAVYNPVNSNNDASSLKRFTEQEAQEVKKKAGAAGGLLKLIAVLEFAGAIGCLVFAVMYGASPDNIKKLSEHIPELSLAMPLGITFCVVGALIAIGGGVGVFLKMNWGWILTAAVVVYLGVARLASAGIVLSKGFEQATFFMAMVPLFAAAAMAMAVFKEEAKLFCGIKKATVPTIVAVLVGAVGASVVFGIIVASASKAPTPGGG